MANEMGSQKLESEANEFEEVDSSYKVITIRCIDLSEEDRRFVKNPFLHSLRDGNNYFKLMDQEAYYQCYGRYVDSLLTRPDTKVNFAVLDDNETYLGWCLYQPEVLHYIWTKKEARLQGVGKSILPVGLKYFTHLTNRTFNIWNKDEFRNLKFNPFL